MSNEKNALLAWLAQLPSPPLGFSSHSKQCQGKIFIALKGAQADGHQFIAELVKNSSCAGYVVAKDFDLEPYKNLGPYFFKSNFLSQTHRDLASYFRKKFKGKIIGIGGSSGKTSTKEFLFQLLSQKFKCFKTEKSQNGDLGIPKTLEQLDQSFEIGIVEIGIDAPGDMLRHVNLVEPDIAVLTSIGEEHLNLLKNIEKIFEEESLLFHKTLAHGGICFAPEADPYLARFRDIPGVNLVSSETHSDQSHLTNSYAQQNAKLAAALARYLGLSEDQISQGLRNLVLPEGRGREIKLSNEKLLIADHYNSNPASLKAGFLHLEKLAKVGQEKVYILGDMLDLGVESENAHRKIAKELCKKPFSKLIFVGPEFLKQSEFFRGKESSVQFFANSAEAAGSIKLLDFPKGACVLLKGSRGIKMELILEALLQQASF